MRAFLGIELSDEIKECYRRFESEGRLRYRELRWVRPENIHLTVRFLGESDDLQVVKVRQEVEAVTSTVVRFRMRLGAPGIFGSGRAPRTLWLGVDDGEDELSALAGGVEAAVRRAGFSPERQPWTPHLTLARNPKGSTAKGWQEALVASGLVGLSSVVEGVTLFESLLLLKGPVYTKVWTASLV